MGLRAASHNQNTSFPGFKAFIQSLKYGTLETETQKRKFRFKVIASGIKYTPAGSGKSRENGYKNLERVFNRVIETGSRRPKDHLELTMNASYALALIGLYLRSIGKSYSAEFTSPHVQGSATTQYWLEIYWPMEGMRPFLGMWFHKNKKPGSEKIRTGDRVIIYEAKNNPNGYEGGASALFATGVLTGESVAVPQDRKDLGNKDWQSIRLIQPVINLSPKEGVPYQKIIKKLPQFHGWVRKGAKLSRENFEILESMLMEQREFNNELTYKEGAEIRFVQTARERNPKLRNDAIRKYGKKCMVCGFDFDERYGKDIAGGYIEVHHVQMLSQSSGQRETRLEDVRVVCSNCHRMIHKKKDMMDWMALKERMQ